MKRIIFIINLIIPLIAFTQNNNDSILIEKNRIDIEELNKGHKELQEKYDYQIKVNDQTLNSISNQISATSYNLSIFAILFGVLAIGLGIYVTWVERKIIRIREENESLLNETQKTKNDVVAINELIQKDIYGLFLKIKREETVHILNRLVKVPEDIANLSNELFSRKLKEEDYSTLKKAFLSLDSNKSASVSSYKLLFFQHFLDQSVKDEEIGSLLINHYSTSVNCANEKDIIKSTEDFMKGVLDVGFQSKGIEINSYIRAISRSDFKNFKIIYKIIFDSLKSRNNRFKFYEVIDSKPEMRLGKNNYGLLLVEEYQDAELTESESGILKEVKELEEQILKDEEQARLEEEKKRKEKEKKALNQLKKRGNKPS